MKPNELADLLNIQQPTLRRWAGVFREFLSPNAQRSESAHRSYDAQDIRIISWIANLRLQNESLENISKLLRRAQADNWIDLPPLPEGIEHDEPIPMMPVETARTSLQAIQTQADLQIKALMRERDELRDRLAKSEQRNEALSEQLREMTQQIIELLKRMNPPSERH